MHEKEGKRSSLAKGDHPLGGGEETEEKREQWQQIQIVLSSCLTANNPRNHSIHYSHKLYTDMKILTNLCYCHPADTCYTHH